MNIADFELERFFARWEFAVRYNLCASDVEPLTLTELLGMADPASLEWWHTLNLGYTTSEGDARLRSEIARLYTGIAADEVLTFSGAEEAIFLLMHALMAAGDHVVTIVPAYQSLHEVARSIGATVSMVALRPEAGWQLDLDVLRSSVRPNTRAIVINYPHNPTGALLDQPSYRALCNFCDENSIYLISDEVYRGLEFEPEHALPAGADAAHNGISIGVMSKVFGLAGLRIGWLATRDARVRAQVARLRDYTTICSSAPSEVLATMALRQADVLRARALRIIKGNLALWEGVLARHADRLSWSVPRAGSTGFIRLAHGDADSLAADLAERHGVLLLPGSAFGAAAPYLRVTLGRAGLEAPLAIFDRYLAERADSLLPRL